MPPAIPPSSPPLLPGTIEVSEDEAAFASFFDLEAAGSALRANAFDIAEEITLLTRLMRDPDPAVALGAHNAFRKVLKEIRVAQPTLNASRTSIDPATGGLLQEHATATRLLAALAAARSRHPHHRAQPHLVRPLEREGAPAPPPDHLDPP